MRSSSFSLSRRAPPPASPRRASPEAGSILVEFLGVALLALGGLLVVVQMGLWIWARNIAVTAAAEGARRGAESGGGRVEALERTRAMLGAGLGRSGDRFTVEVRLGPRTISVHARGEAPVVLTALSLPPVEARATALLEDLVLR